MGSILINVPDFSDDELIFDEDETKRILKFFRPHLSGQIGSLEIENNLRRLAQSALVAAVDGSFALGFVYVLAKTIVRPHAGIRSLLAKLARRSAIHWWKHATRAELQDARIFDSVKRSIGAALWQRLNAALNGVALMRCEQRFYAAVDEPRCAWGLA